MRQGLAVLALVVCSALPAAGEDAKYRSKDGKFDVRFPAGAKVRTDSRKGDGVEMHAVIADDGPTRRLTVTYTDVPAVKDERTKEFFDQIEKSAVRKAGGQVASSADVEFGAMKHPGREFVVDKGGDKAKVLLVLVGTRLYSVSAAGPKEFARSKDADAFFASFEITK